MLTLSPSATEAIDRLTVTYQVGPRGGFRLRLAGPPEPGCTVDVEAAPWPRGDDDVIAFDETQLFLSREARECLNEKILDAREDYEGHYTFSITNAGC